MMPTFAQTTPSLNSATAQVPKETVELDPVIADKINLQCTNFINEYEELRNLEVCIYLVHKNIYCVVYFKYDYYVGYSFIIDGREITHPYKA